MSEFVSGSPGQMEGRELPDPLRQMQWVVGLGLPTPKPFTAACAPGLLPSSKSTPLPPCLGGSSWSWGLPVSRVRWSGVVHGI